MASGAPDGFDDWDYDEEAAREEARERGEALFSELCALLAKHMVGDRPARWKGLALTSGGTLLAPGPFIPRLDKGAVKVLTAPRPEGRVFEVHKHPRDGLKVDTSIVSVSTYKTLEEVAGAIKAIF